MEVLFAPLLICSFHNCICSFQKCYKAVRTNSGADSTFLNFQKQLGRGNRGRYPSHRGSFAEGLAEGLIRQFKFKRNKNHDSVQ